MRKSRDERICKQCHTGVEDEIHVLLYCPVLLAERQAHVRELREEVRTGQGDVTSLLTLLAGLNDATTFWHVEDGSFNRFLLFT